jgi:hypothetical protein
MQPATKSTEPIRRGLSLPDGSGDRAPKPGRPGSAPYQDGLTIITRILPGHEEALYATLRSIGEAIETNDLVPFRSLERIHFARWFVLDAGEDDLGRPTAAQLVFSSNFDEPREAHLGELFEKARRGLDAIYQHCDGYPPEGARTRERVIRYLDEREVGYDTLYVGARGRTVKQIEQEALLRNGIQVFLDRATRRPGFLDLSPEEIRREIQEFVRSRPELRWAEQPGPSRRRIWPRWRDLQVFLPLALLLIGLPLVVGVRSGPGAGLLALVAVLAALGLLVGGWLAVIRSKERKDAVAPPYTEFSHVSRLTQDEDRFVQNPMSVVNAVKAGPIRRVTLRLVLRAIDLAARYVATKGELGGIPSIHFARWVMIEGGRRVLFMSNYDGSWESYLGDFIDKAAAGLTAVWGNTHGFPRTRLLIHEGATDEQRFKAYARRSQLPTPVWYSAYKWLSVQNVNNNSMIRDGLFAPMTPEEIREWLQRL